MVISHTHNFIFVHTYKVAGTSITEALAPFGLINPPTNLRLATALRATNSNRLLRAISRRVLHSYSHHDSVTTIQNKTEQRIWQGYFKFAFVRNPFDWQVSLYHYISQNKRHFLHHNVKGMTFEEYVEWRVYHKLKTQSDFLADSSGKIGVDYIGRYESLSEDMQHIAQKLGLILPLPHLNRSVRSGDYRRYYGPTTRKMIEDVFVEDLLNFGYDF